MARKWITDHWRRLVLLDAAPGAVALGFAVGVFLGFTPLFGLKTLLALAIAWLLGASKVAAVIGVTLHDLLLPFMPVLLRMEYQLGYWCLARPHHFAPRLHLHQHLRLHDALSWTTTGPLLIGSVILGLPLALLAYALIRVVLARARGRFRSRISPDPAE